MQFWKHLVIFGSGSAVGILVDSAIGDYWWSQGLPMMGIATVELLDVALLAAEGVLAYYLHKKGHANISNFVLGMFCASIAREVYELFVALGLIQPYVPSQTLSQTSNPALTQQVSTSGETVTSYPRTSFVLGNGGSVSEITRLPENSGRGEAVQPAWRNWEGTFGGIQQKPPSQIPYGTFNGAPSGLTLPESEHVTPEIEQRLAQIASHRTWETGGLTPTGTFG